MCRIPSASRRESRQHNRGEWWANRITNKSDGSNGAQRFVPLNRFPDTRISSLDRVGIQGFKNAGRKSRTSAGRKKGNKFRQIVDFRERNAILGQERFQIFLRALLCMETDGVPGTWEAVRLLSILRRSCSAFSTHRRTISGLLGGPVIEDLPFTQCGCDHGAGNVAVLHTIPRRHDDQVLRNAHSGK